MYIYKVMSETYYKVMSETYVSAPICHHSLAIRHIAVTSFHVYCGLGHKYLIVPEITRHMLAPH